MNIRYHLNRGILRLQGHKLFDYFDEYKKREYLPIEENRKTQKEKLKQILLYAYRNCPYYRKILGDVEVIRNDDKVNLSNFSMIPILSKEIIRTHFEDLKSNDEKYQKRKPYFNTSGGSTGEPVKFIQDKVTWDSGMASKWFFSTFLGKYPGEEEIKLWGSERDILKGSIGFKAKLKNFTFNRTLLNSFRMSERDMRRYVEIINKEKPKIIVAYVQSIYELANFIENNNLKVFSPKGIITAAGTLYPEFKKLIEGVFNCKVCNLYGSREVGDMACSCEKDEGLHIDIFNHYFEILNDRLEPCKPGESGKVYVTTLNNYSMPLIRYDIGDMAVPAKNEQCSCGRGLPLIEKVVGRSTSMIKTRKGFFDGTALTTSFYFFESIKKYQFVQKRIDHIVINIVIANEKLWEQEKELIKTKLKKILGEEVKINFHIVDEISPSKSGKYLYFISELE